MTQTDVEARYQQRLDRYVSAMRLGQPDRIPLRPLAAEFTAVFAQQLTDSARRAAGLTLVALEAARADEDIAAVAAQLMTQRQVMAAWLVDGLLRRSPLRQAVDRAAATDTVWALMDPALFCRLTGDRHWSPARFRRWFTDATLRLLLPVPGQQAAPAVSAQELP